MKKIFEQEDIYNRVSQALLWLGLEDVEFEKRFSANKFEAGNKGEEVYETNITYNNTDQFLPDKAVSIIIKMLENVIDYHLRKKDIETTKEKLEAQYQKN